MDTEAYLERIGYQGSRAVSKETLRDLHLAHLLSVPFENLSISRGEPILLEEAALFKKIVTRKRGGFCYELNGLFAALLRDLGFRVTMLSAGVAGSNGSFGPPFDHMTLLVRLEDRWLADVGFGDSFDLPLLLDSGESQTQNPRPYQLEEDPEGRRILRRMDSEGTWTDQYRFDLIPHQMCDYVRMCTFHQTSPESHFTQGRVCTRKIPEGRITLSGMRLISTKNGERSESTLSSEAEVVLVLRNHFGIDTSM